jgi:hypothetical protein
LNCRFVPAGIDGLFGVTAIEFRMGGPTVRGAEPAMGPNIAVIVALPELVLVAKPVVLMLAIVGADELQLTELVIFFELLSV